MQIANELFGIEFVEMLGCLFRCGMFAGDVIKGAALEKVFYAFAAERGNQFPVLVILPNNAVGANLK